MPNVFVLVVAVLVAIGVGFGAAYLLLQRRQGHDDGTSALELKAQ